MAERQDGILGRIARLHPGWVTWLGVLALGAIASADREDPVGAALFFVIFALLYMGYPLFVVRFLTVRFGLQNGVRPLCALAAFLAFTLIGLASCFENLGLQGAPDNFENVVSLVIRLLLALSFTAAWLYLPSTAAKVLAEAEKGAPVRFWQNLRTVIQFFNLPVFIFFIHRRIQRLAAATPSAPVASPT